MERNWLIRTSQNQILGPVAKQKLLEFIEKGALGLNDEVASGNGYWFSLRERDLVDKYIYGDIPQGYNPISESKSVLAKKENPDKTTSINTAPANRGQILRTEKDSPGILPKNEDLEFPDLGKPTLNSQTETTDITRLPKNEDLEFPDITLIAAKVQSSMSADGMQSLHSTPSVAVSMPKAEPTRIDERNLRDTSNEPVLYPKDEDLDFPDIDSIKNDKTEKTSEFEFRVPIQSSKEVVEEIKPPTTTLRADLESDFGEATLTLIQTKPAAKETPKEAPRPVLDKPLKKKEIVAKEPIRDEDKKLLHDRKAKPAKTPVRENREVVSIESAPAPLKRRNDNYLFFILIIVALIMLAVFFYFKEILNKPLPV